MERLEVEAAIIERHRAEATIPPYSFGVGEIHEELTGSGSVPFALSERSVTAALNRLAGWGIVSRLGGRGRTSGWALEADLDGIAKNLEEDTRFLIDFACGLSEWDNVRWQAEILAETDVRHRDVRRLVMRAAGLRSHSTAVIQQLAVFPEGLSILGLIKEPEGAVRDRRKQAISAFQAGTKSVIRDLMWQFLVADIGPASWMVEASVDDVEALCAS